MRKKMYILCRRVKGRILCIADESTMSICWSKNTALCWDKPPEHYLKHYRKREGIKDVFIARVNSSSCPVEIVWDYKAPRANKGNRIFREKTMLVQHECKECGFKGEVMAIAKMVTCPQCKTVNDVWLEGEKPPPRHRNMRT